MSHSEGLNSLKTGHIYVEEQREATDTGVLQFRRWSDFEVQKRKFRSK
jgi:hypothetical protein